MVTPPAQNSPSLRALLDAIYRFKENPQPHFPDPAMEHYCFEHLTTFEMFFYHDLNQLHPITYGMGFLEASAVEMEKKVRVEADYNREKIALISNLLKAYNTVIDQLEAH